MPQVLAQGDASVSLWIRTPADQPHAASEDDSLGTDALARCGVILVDAKEITEAQAEKYLGDARCPACFPGWAHHKGQSHGH